MLCFKQPREKFLEGGEDRDFSFPPGDIGAQVKGSPQPPVSGNTLQVWFWAGASRYWQQEEKWGFFLWVWGGDRGDAAQGPRVSLEDDTLQGVWGSQGHPCLLGSLNMYKPVCESHQPLAEWTEQDVHANEWKTSVGLQESGLSVFKQKRGKVIPGSRVGYAAPK